MSAPHLNPVLARFIASRSVSLAGLQRWLSKATKVPGRARAAIEHGHQRWLGKVGQDATALVAGAGVPPLQALRNAVATALPADLPVWSHVMDCDALGAFGTPVEVRAIIDVARLRYQPDSNWLPSALKAVQCAASATPSAVLPAVRSSWQVALAVIEEMPAPEALEAMREVIDDRCRRGNADPDSTDERWRLRLIAGCEALLGRRHDLRFGYEEFRELPADLRGAIKDLTLWVTDAGRARMAQIARRRAKRDAQQGARLEAAVGAFVGAIDELVSQKTDRCWGKVADALVELRAAGGGRPGRDCDPRLLECLARSSAEWLLLPHAPKPVLDRLARAGRSPIARASWFLAAPRAIQCRSRLCHHDEGLAGLPLAIPAPMHRALVDCATSEYVRVSRDRARIWNLWKPIETFGKRTEHDGIVADAWATAFSEGRKLSKDELPRFFRWIDMLTPSKLQKLEAEHGPWLTRRARRPAFVADMFRLRSRAATTWVLGLHSVLRYSNAVAAVAKMSNRDRREALTSDLRALLTMGPDGSHGHHETIAARLIADGVRQLGLRRTIDLLEPVLDASRLIALLRSCDEEQLHSKGAIATLRAAVTMGPTRLSRAMRQALDTKEGLPDAARHAVWAATYSASRDRALKLLIRHPKQFAEVACASAPLPWLVGSAATKPGLAAHLSPHLERSRLVAALPVIRKQFGVRRRSCAVTELAIMSDLREMDHLRAIAWAGRGATNLQAGCLLDSRYRTYELPKRSGGVRIITAPDPRLKRLQRRLLVGAFQAVPLHDAVHGFRSGRSIATNAARHVGQRLVVNVDIEGFFPNTKFQQVLSACKRVDGGRLSPYAARLLAEICCYAGALPTGAPTSPAVANIVLRPADTAIAKAAATHGISYTRYADDLTFSGEGDAKRIIPFVRRVLAQAGYRLDQRKTQLYRRGRQQLVTNLVVNERVNLRRSDRRRLRAAVHHRCVGRPAEWHGRAMDDHALEGCIALLAMVDRKEAALLLARLRSQASGWRSRDA